MTKVLFLYPNKNTELRIPLAVSILINRLRNAGHEVKLFDPSFMGEFHTDNEKMEKLGTHLPTNLGVNSNSLVVKDEFEKILKSFKPDLICASVVERNLNTCKELLIDTDIPVLLGGIMPTIAPDHLIDQDWVDVICVGEGEGAIVDLANSFETKIPNLWTKEIANPLRPLIDLDTIEQDWSDFDERHLSKPFMGKVYRAGAFEFSRGCFRSCSFCVAPRLRKVQHGLGSYHRTKTPEVAIKEIENKVSQYKLNFVAFGDTDFLTAKADKVWEFLKLYSERINLPFTIQTAVETLLNEKTLKLLRKAKCVAISVGVESGSKRIQKEILKKPINTQLIKKAFDLCRKNELRVTANFMLGLPTETEEDVRDTMKLNRLIGPPSIAVTYFTPFMGTELYDLCIEKGYYEPFKENVYEYPPLKMKQLSQERIKELVSEFVSEFNIYKKDFNIINARE